MGSAGFFSTPAPSSSRRLQTHWACATVCRPPPMPWHLAYAEHGQGMGESPLASMLRDLGCALGALTRSLAFMLLWELLWFLVYGACSGHGKRRVAAAGAGHGAGSGVSWPLGVFGCSVLQCEGVAPMPIAPPFCSRPRSRSRPPEGSSVRARLANLWLFSWNKQAASGAGFLLAADFGLGSASCRMAFCCVCG